MKASLKWLRDYVDIRLTAKELAKKLTMAGMEVKGMQSTGKPWNNIVVGEVIAISAHPNADRLKLATVDVGDRQITVVCGAPNISIGQRVPFAHVNAELIDGHTGRVTILKPVKIRGILSEGMVCSEKELGISDRHEGIMVLPSDAPVGMPLGEYLGDMIFDLEITPNRPDCLSMVGIAREIAALSEERLHLPEIRYEEMETSIDSFVSIDIIEPKLCPRYCASLISGASIAPSPNWLQQRLSSYGIRPINNIVDVTNYVMLEYGQPLHAFDYDKLAGKHIMVRRGRDAETMVTLDGIQRALNHDVLVISDEQGAVAIAGIMGGLSAEVTDSTSTVLLESANFDRAIIRQGCSHLNLKSEASIRFDKGLNPDLPLVPLKRATQLLLQLAGGKAAKGIVDVYPGKSEPASVPLSTEAVRRISGMEVTTDETLKILRSLGFECEENDSQILVKAPYWRSDIHCTADLVEEVVRIVGYEKVPVTTLSGRLPPKEPKVLAARRENNLKQKVRRILVGCGFQEILTYSLTSLERLRNLSPRFELKVMPLKVVNPMTREQEYLRTTLQAGLLAALAHNQRVTEAGLRLFEVGKVFLPRGRELPEEREMLCAAVSGPRHELSWHGNKELLDFFDAKGVVENLLGQLGLRASFESSGAESLFPGRSADIIIGDDKVGVVGDLHPRVAQAFELAGTVCLIEMDIEKLYDKTTKLGEYRPIRRFPTVTRDIALVVDEGVNYQKVEEIIRSFSLVTEVVLFDLYTGEQIPKGKKSFAIRVVYQSPDRNLTDEEVNLAQQEIVDRLHRELGANLRG